MNGTDKALPRRGLDWSFASALGWSLKLAWPQLYITLFFYIYPTLLAVRDH
jgi:hypothetical protein